MNPEEYLEFLESTQHMNGAITHIRDDLVNKGWTVGGAEGAAISIFGIAMQHAMMQQPKGRGR